MTGLDSRFPAAMRCIVLLLAVVVGGTVGFWMIEPDWGVWKSLYFTLITITTVGYGDQGVSEDGEKFAAVMLLCGIGCFTYSVTTLIHLALDRESARKRRMMKQIEQFQDHIIVCGYGRMGKAVCDHLIAGGQQCVIIESNSEHYELAISHGRHAVLGSASEDSVLLAGGIERAQGVISVVDSDADNIFVVVSARELNRECSIVARAETESAARKMERAGASFVVLPHRMAGEDVATAVMNPRLAKMMHSSQTTESRLVLGEAEVHTGSPLVGATVREFGAGAGDLVFVAISREGTDLIMRPGGAEVFQSGDILICAGRSSDLQTVQSASESAVCT